MSKRFTDTDKWKKPFIRTMKAPYKLLWLYILDECDHAGIWHVDFEVAEIRIGERLKKEQALDAFKEKIIVFDCGHKWLIPDFINFQYGELKDANRVHYSIIQILSKYNLIKDNKPLTSPLQGAKDMDKEKDKEKDKDKEESKTEKKAEIPEVKTSFSDLFKTYWQAWKDYKKTQFRFEYKTLDTEQTAYNELEKLASSKEEIAIAIIQQSIGNGWKGFFEIKNFNHNGQYKNNIQPPPEGEYRGF